MTRVRLWPLLVLGCFALGVAVTSRSAEGQPAPYEFHAILSQTGPGAFLAKAQTTSLGIMEQYVNAQGGIRGRPIKFTIADDQSTPAVAVQLLNGLAQRKVPVVFGSSIAATCNAIAPLIPAGPVVYCFSGGVQPAKGSYMFAFGSNLVIHVPVGIRYLRERGLKKIAILTTTDASGKDGERNVDLALALPENKDVTIVAREYFAPGDVSVSAQVAKIKAAGAQAVTMWSVGASAATAFRGLQDAGLDVPVLMSGGNAIPGQMKQFSNILPKDLLVVIPPSTVYDDLPNGALKTAVGTYVSTFKAAGLEPDVPLGIAWDPVLIVVNALRSLGTEATPAQIRDYISNVRGFAGANGEYDFRDGSNLGLSQNQTIVTRWDPAKGAFTAVSRLGGVPR